MENLSNKIESLLFYQVEPIKTKKLADILEVGETEISQSIDELEENLKQRGIKLIKND
jgi:chromosome segregation and condensation protein ScpB